MFTWKRALITACCLIVLTAAFTAFILPGIVKNQAETWVAENTDRVLQIGEIAINPITLVVEVRNLALSEVDHEQSFVAWKKLRVALSPRSLFHLAPVLREIRLADPRIHLERLEASRFNFSDLIPASDETAEPAADTEPAHFSLNNIVIENGQIELIDRSLPDEVTHTVRELNLAVPFLGNLPYLVEEPVQPLFSAIINDSPIEMKGALKPFAETQEFSLRLVLDDIDLPYYLAYVPVELPLELRSGRLGVDLQMRYRAGMQQAPDLLLSGDINLTAFNLWNRQDQELLFLPMFRAVIAPSHPLDRDIHLASIDLYNLEAHLARDQAGVWNFDRLMPAKTTTPEETADKEGAEESALKLAIDQFRLRDGVLTFNDDLPRGGFQTTAHTINLDLKNISLEPDTAISAAASFATDNAEQVSVEGYMGLTPLFVDVTVQADKLPLAVYQPYYQEMVAIKPGGQLDLAARLTIDDGTPFALSEGRAELRALDLPLPKREGFRLERLTLDGLAYDLAANTLVLNSVTLEKGNARLSRDSAGAFSFQSPDYPALIAAPQKSGETSAAPAATDSRPLSYRIGNLAFSDWSFDFKDRLPAEPAHLALSGVNITASELVAPDKVASPFKLNAVLNRTGRINLSGKATIATQDVTVNSRLRALPLNVLAPYIAEQAGLVLVDGRLDARLNTRVSNAPDGLQARFSGAVGIDKLYCLDAAHQEDLLKWDSLQVAEIDGRWAPLNLAIGSITISDYFAKVLIDEEGGLNFAQVFQKETPPEVAALAEQEPVVEEEIVEDTAVPGTAPQIRIDQVTLQGGQVDFTDRHLPNTFHADMRELGGSISGLNSDLATQATVDLRGKLRNQSPLLIEGVVNPLADELFLDLKFSFNDIEMSPMSPYSGTYLGYMIEKGKLNLALEYLVEEGALQASNQVFLDQFTFGESVESDKATGLPVRLAVALLKDGNGEIHLDIPVSGELDDPEFSIAGVVWTIIKNLLVKAATSPLALLGALAGGGDEDFSSVTFDYGLSLLPPAEQEKLAHMAKALLNRPSLTLEVHGFVDPENDPEGYRQAELRRQIERVWTLDRAKQQETDDEAAPGIEDLSPEEYSDYLWQVYKQADFPRPRNFVGMLKHLPDEELTKLIYTNTPAGEAELAQLAQNRAQTVRDYLVEQAGIAPERVFLIAPDINQPPENKETLRSRVEFNISVK